MFDEDSFANGVGSNFLRQVNSVEPRPNTNNLVAPCLRVSVLPTLAPELLQMRHFDSDVSLWLQIELCRFPLSTKPSISKLKSTKPSSVSAMSSSIFGFYNGRTPCKALTRKSERNRPKEPYRQRLPGTMDISTHRLEYPDWCAISDIDW